MALDQITSQAIAPNAISADNVANGSVTAAKLHDTAIADKLGYTPVSPTQLNNLIDSAPGALDTLNELAAALGDDANFASTVTTALTAKATPADITPSAVSNKANTSTGYFALPAGTTAERPANPTGNMIRKNTSTGYIEYYDPSTSQWIGLGAFQATGGTETTYSSGGADYKVHTFTSSGTFTVTAGAKAIEYLIVAAGGGGGPIGGGGGAGGVLAGSITSTTGTYSIVIGGGGNVGQGGSTQATNGGNTTALGLTAIGGGGAGQHMTGPNSLAGLSGGSGGGGGDNATSGGSGTAGQGNAGGTGISGIPDTQRIGGGGGGAGAVGANGSSGGHGGNGIQSSINGTNYYWGGGGGAGGYNSSTGGNGGLGGGGGGSVSSGTAGTGGGSALNSGSNGTVGDAQRGGNGGANTGGGGGGCAWQFPASGQQGGSGIVIIRYTV